MNPKDNPGFLLHHLAFVLDRQSDLVLQEQLGIGFSQFKILMALKWHAGVQQKQIANRLGQTEASISRQIKLMHRQGLLKTNVSPLNRRQHITTLTTKGDRLAQSAIELLNTYHSPMFANLSPHQQETFREILQIMHSHACPDSAHQDKSGQF